MSSWKVQKHALRCIISRLCLMSWRLLLPQRSAHSNNVPQRTRMSAWLSSTELMSSWLLLSSSNRRWNKLPSCIFLSWRYGGVFQMCEWYILSFKLKVSNALSSRYIWKWKSKQCRFDSFMHQMWSRNIFHPLSLWEMPSMHTRILLPWRNNYSLPSHQSYR